MERLVDLRPLVLFDGDDTLWSTMPLYSKAKEFFAARVRLLTDSAEEAIDLLDRIDQENVQRMGFSPNRFPTSLVQAYRQVCLTKFTPPDAAVESELRQAGELVFVAPAVTMPEAASTLRRLRPYCDLALVTKGDPAIQGSRLQASGLQPYFDSTTILADKSQEQFEAILVEYQCSADKAWSIGNSIRSDINPALRTGMSAIWIPNPTWRHEEEPLVEHSRLFTCRSLSEAANIVLQEIR